MSHVEVEMKGKRGMETNNNHDDKDAQIAQLKHIVAVYEKAFHDLANKMQGRMLALSNTASGIEEDFISVQSTVARIKHDVKMKGIVKTVVPTRFTA